MMSRSTISVAPKARRLHLREKPEEASRDVNNIGKGMGLRQYDVDFNSLQTCREVAPLLEELVLALPVNNQASCSVPFASGALIHTI